MRINVPSFEPKVQIEVGDIVVIYSTISGKNMYQLHDAGDNQPNRYQLRSFDGVMVWNRYATIEEIEKSLKHSSNVRSFQTYSKRHYQLEVVLREV
jgi:hypothetical protein